MMSALIASSRCAPPPATPLQCRNRAADVVSSTRPSLSLRRENPSIVKCTKSETAITSDHKPVVVSDRLHNVTTPWLMLPSEVDATTGEMLDCFYSLADDHTVRLNRKKSLKVPDTATCFASAMSWLAFVDTTDCSVYLSNPYLNDVVQLPSLETLPNVLGVQRDLNSGAILNFKVRDENATWSTKHPDPYYMETPKYMAWHISDLAISYPNPRSCDAVVMAIVGSDCRGRLAYCPIFRNFEAETDFDAHPQKQDSADRWIGLQEDYNPGLQLNQVVYSRENNLFISLFQDAGIQAFDVHQDRGHRSKMVSQFPMKDLQLRIRSALEDVESSEALKALRSMCRKKYYLVTPENGDLLLIVRYYKFNGHVFDTNPPHQTFHFDVFRVNYMLEHLSTLERRAIFIGRNQSFCLKARADAGIKPNCIYFTDDICCTNVHAHGNWGHDMGIFNMNDSSISPCYPYPDAEQEKKVRISKPLFWIAPLPWYASDLVPEVSYSDLTKDG